MITPGMLGGMSALCLGTADFMGRFSSRAIDHHNAVLGILITSSLLMTGWVIAISGIPSFEELAIWLIVINGLATMGMTLLLYLGLARGPISVVVSIVASHPILVVLFYVLFLDATPSILQWMAIFVTIAGTIIVSCGGDTIINTSIRAKFSSRLITTIFIALGSCFAYAVLVVAGQAASQVHGQVYTLWIGRLAGILFLLAVFGARRCKPSIPFRWWPFLGAQGTLDAGGYLFLFAGSYESGKEIVAVVSATFGVVTILLARFFLREKIMVIQWFGIFLVFTGVAVLGIEKN
ncbi:MAG: hypothetical protein CFH06_01136 [Alphaproteobacteria bacterium MarineAlpha3_Bin5]|nr:hypothetical protein [Magnetovibrio sp.]PPR77713.1 MAG: hypothetical protein CFH06_01136 [Alphaproteobacteria bacterium MarineAlpha3_Bin5]